MAFGETNDGELLLVDHDRTHQIYRLVPSPGTSSRPSFPRRLSECGLFASVRTGQPAPGVLPFDINSKLWSDGATAERLLAVPGTGKISLSAQGTWQFPEGSVLARTISLEVEPGKPASRRRTETQVLHFEAGAWRPYSYLWNDQQDDAELVGADGATRAIKDARPGSKFEKTYRVAARSECVLCHNPWVEKKTTVFGIQSASPLGLNTAQLNKPSAHSEFNGNQLTFLHAAGILSWTPDLSKLPSLVDPYDESADLDRRARSYLQTNCAHCHQFNAGGTANIALGFEVPLKATQTIGIRPIQGTFGIAGARIIAPGDPAGSVLYVPNVEARRGSDAAGRVEPGRRARIPDDPRLDRAHARSRRISRRRSEARKRRSRIARSAAQARSSLAGAPNEGRPEAGRNNPRSIASAWLDRSRTGFLPAQD